jgi:hypothetical protein
MLMPTIMMTMVAACMLTMWDALRAAALAESRYRFHLHHLLRP